MNTPIKHLENIVYIYTDGACSGNPGPGGWGAVLVYNGHEKDLSGYEAQTTNNRMELLAAIEGLSALTRPMPVIIVSDSKYVQQGILEWLPNWIKRNWKTAANQPVKNQDLWQRLSEASKIPSSIEWQWVKGHAGHEYNEKADQLARDAIVKNRGY